MTDVPGCLDPACDWQPDNPDDLEYQRLMHALEDHTRSWEIDCD